jgi:hypothetical protein
MPHDFVSLQSGLQVCDMGAIPENETLSLAVVSRDGFSRASKSEVLCQARFDLHATIEAIARSWSCVRAFCRTGSLSQTTLCPEIF